MTLRSANPDDPRPDGRRVRNAERQQRDKLSDELYERYAKPLEAEHWGEFIIIAPDGRYVLGDSRTRVLKPAALTIGRGHQMYRLGSSYVGEALVSNITRTVGYC